MRELNKTLSNDPRIDTLLLPLFDGIAQIQWKAGHLVNAEKTVEE